MGILLLKLCLAPVLVVGSTVAGRRWGADVAGILVGLPIVAGPILVISHLLHGAGFTAGAARSSLLGLVALAVFAVVFAHVARRFGWLVTTAVSWLAVLVVDVVLSLLRVWAVGAFAITVVAAAVALLLMPTVEPERLDGTRPPSWDLPGRAIATGLLVLAVTTASGALGPQWTGLLAPFPVATTVVAGFVHAQQGSAATARTLAGVLVGLFGFAVFCLFVAVFVGRMGGVVFFAAAGVTVVVQLLVMRVRRVLRDRRTAPVR
ncbi:hypothetical protein [Saccharothrix variisporea]|uniref:Uncharacterized protein n=1 Tax=Saccharothrix variisporea TaxID=543527 RepID=A0A495X5M2_9PSEU|nr:hypothetical protein [Saccharothrix variisporea]RKT69167.1 hypothetical protein DFJ66_2362 [Saccharothrix variisporea]